jgi:arylsulfatase A-like enzyme
VPGPLAIGVPNAVDGIPLDHPTLGSLLKAQGYVSDGLTARIKAGEGKLLVHTDGGSLETYGEMVEDLDKAVGKVLGALEASGQLQDTLVFVASDNGGERFSYYWPFSGGKGNVEEGGIRIANILSWPGH